MIKAIFRTLENPQRTLIGPNYWLMQKAGLILPKSKKARYAYIFAHELVVFFVVTQYMELYFIKTDLQKILSNLKISMLSTIGVVKVNTFVLWQKIWTEIMDFINETDQFERQSKDEVKRNIIERYTSYCRRATYLYWSLTFITVLTIHLVAFVGYLSSSSSWEKIHNGTDPFPQIFSSWMPFDKYHSPGCWFTLLWYIYLSVYGVLITAAYDTGVMVIMVFFCCHLELLRESCKQMMGSLGKGISDEQADKVVRQIHTTHNRLTKYSTLFNSVLSPVMFLYVVTCSLMLCASAFEITVATSAAQMLLLSEYLLASIGQLFVFCWHSNDVLEKSEMVHLGPYESEWWATSLRQKKSVLILCGKLRKSYLFTAGPFTPLTLSTFVTILKGAYSYYTLLNNQ